MTRSLASSKRHLRSEQPAATPTRNSSPVRRVSSPILAILGSRSALLVALSAGAGIIAVFSGPFEYRCTLELGIGVAQRGEPVMHAYQQELLAHLWATRDDRHLDPIAARLDVETDAQRGTLRVSMFAHAPGAGRDDLVRLTRTYRDHLASVARTALATPSEGERILGRLLESQEQQLTALLNAAGDHPRSPNETSPLEQRDTISAMLAVRRAHVETLRQRRAAAIAKLDALRARPIPESPPLDPDTRRAAHEADVELTQDLKSATVQLSDVKHRLLEVWQSSSPQLDALQAAATELCALGDGKAFHSATGPHRLAAEKLTEAAAAYQQRLAKFSASWTRQLVTLRETGPDPHRPEVLKTCQVVTKLLGDYLFDSIETLAKMQEQASALSNEVNNAARHHALIAEATKHLRRVRTAHHQFEFAASDIKTVNNFRLDAAVKSATGLCARAQRRVRAIDDGLRRLAYEQAVQQRDDQIVELQRELQECEQNSDTHIASLLEAEDELANTMPLADTFLQAQVSAKETDRQIERLRSQINSTRTELDRLTASKKAPVDPNAVSVIDRHIDRTPANLAERLAYGWLTTATALLVILLGQWLVTGHRARHASKTPSPRNTPASG